MFLKFTPGGVQVLFSASIFYRRHGFEIGLKYLGIHRDPARRSRRTAVQLGFLTSPSKLFQGEAP
jgi:hypothetical protein